MWAFLSVLAWATVAVLAAGVALKAYVWGRRAFLATAGAKPDDAGAPARLARLDRWARRLLRLGVALLAVVVVAGFVAGYVLRPAR